MRSRLVNISKRNIRRRPVHKKSEKQSKGEQKSTVTYKIHSTCRKKAMRQKAMPWLEAIISSKVSQ
jgi:hypothetical protein